MQLRSDMHEICISQGYSGNIFGSDGHIINHLHVREGSTFPEQGNSALQVPSPAPFNNLVVPLLGLVTRLM